MFFANLIFAQRFREVGSSTSAFGANLLGAMAGGLLEEADERPDPDLDDERRRYYRATPLGAAVLEAETARMSTLVVAARAKRVRAR